jgi:dTDP-glucose 4,6-dehydratase
MTLLITGGAGFIGSNFARFVLKKHPHLKVVIIDSLSLGSNLSNLKDLGKKRPKLVKGSIMDSKLLSRLLLEADEVVNFAAETHVDRSISNPGRFVRTNTLGVHKILEAMRRSGNEVRLVQIGTDEEYGDAQGGSFTELDRLSPSSPYAASKTSASMLVLAYVRTYGLDAKVTRCTNNYGPYQFPEKLIPKTIIRAHLGLKVPVYGDGLNSRD